MAKMINKYLKVKTPETDDLVRISTLVMSKVPNPLDKYEIAATLEFFGWNDNRVKETFGQENIFSLSESIWDFVQKGREEEPAEQYESKFIFRNYLTESLKTFLRGLTFASPLAISAIGVLVLRFSLWSGKAYTQSMVTSISIWAIISMIAIGGFTQAVARRSFIYPEGNSTYGARKTAYYYIRLGLIFSIGAAGYFFLLNWLFPIYPSASIIILCFLFLSAIWLCFTMLYILKQELAVSGLISAGAVLAFVLSVLFKLSSVYSLLIALCMLAIAGYFVSKKYFLQAEEKLGQGNAAPLPHPSLMLFTTLPYFRYGLFYFLFLSLDRLLAWSAHSSQIPYLFLFRGDYEFGLDFAMFAFLIPLGLAEVFAGDILLKSSYNQRNYSIKEMSLINRLYKNYYLKKVYIISLFCLISGILLYYFLTFLSGSGFVPLNTLSNPVTHFVLIIAIISYSVLSLGLMNSLLLFRHAQPRMAGHAIIAAILANLALGFILSRWITYSWAVFGLLGGSVVFWLLTTRAVLKTFSDLQYNLFLAQ